MFGTITLWKVLPSDRDEDGFSKLPGECLTAPQTLLKYLQLLPDNPLCIFKPTGLLPIGEKKALSIEELCVRFQEACIDYPLNVAEAAKNWKELAAELFCYIYTQPDYSPKYENCMVTKGKLVNTLPPQSLQVALYIQILHGVTTFVKARDIELLSAVIEIAGFLRPKLHFTLQDLRFFDRYNPYNYFFFVGLDDIMKNRKDDERGVWGSG